MRNFVKEYLFTDTEMTSIYTKEFLSTVAGMTSISLASTGHYGLAVLTGGASMHFGFDAVRGMFKYYCKK